MSKAEELQKEIIDNARADRARLVDVADGLVKMMGKAKQGNDDQDTRIDPEVAMALSDQLSSVTDSLTKVNQQLVELVRIDTRRILTPQELAKFNSKDKDSVYAELEGNRKLS